MLPKLLVIQSRKNETAAALEAVSIARECGSLVTVSCISVLDTTLEWDQPEQLLIGYSGVIFGGSGDFDFDGGRDVDDEAVCMSRIILERLRPLLSYVFSRDIPTLGICFGHQLLGSFAGANVTYDISQKKTRSHTVSRVASTDSTILLDGLPETFDAYYIHKDALDRVPDGAELVLSGGECCQVAALQYGKNIFTTQFHPELTFDDVLVRIDSFPGYLPDKESVETLFSKDTPSNTILRNFALLVSRQ